MTSQPNNARLLGSRRFRWALARITVVTAFFISMVPAIPVNAGTFDDVPPTYWAEPSIDTITTAGIMEGCGGTFFCPYEVVTREDMAVWLERGMRGVNYELPAATGVFDDVPASYCLAPWIEQLYDDGITAGCSASPPLFCPFQPLTRAEMAVFLLAARHFNDDPPWGGPPPCTGLFQDVPCPGGFAVDWIEELYREGITAGCSKTPLLFCPGAQVNRDQMAVFMVATFNVH